MNSLMISVVRKEAVGVVFSRKLVVNSARKMFTEITVIIVFFKPPLLGKADIILCN
jgi:hypothetical protein